MRLNMLMSVSATVLVARWVVLIYIYIYINIKAQNSSMGCIEREKP